MGAHWKTLSWSWRTATRLLCLTACAPCIDLYVWIVSQRESPLFVSVLRRPMRSLELKMIFSYNISRIHSMSASAHLVTFNSFVVSKYYRTNFHMFQTLFIWTLFSRNISKTNSETIPFLESVSQVEIHIRKTHLRAIGKFSNEVIRPVFVGLLESKC